MAASLLVRRVALAALTVAAGLVLSLGHIALVSAQANTCMPRSEVVKHLASEFKEQTAAVGIAENGSGVYEILASADGETWTLLYSLPNGLSCLLATGQSWQTLPQVTAVGPGA